MTDMILTGEIKTCWHYLKSIYICCHEITLGQYYQKTYLAFRTILICKAFAFKTFIGKQ